MVQPEVLAALARETLSHTDPRFVEIYRHSLTRTRELFTCHQGEVFVLAGSGTLAMEMSLLNTVQAGERILVLSQGYFGDRFAQIAQRYGILVDCLTAEWGKRVAAPEVASMLSRNRYRAVTITHVDTSTGVQADLETLVPLIKQHGALVILDGVCASAALEESMSRESGNPASTLDVVLTGSQKAIGLPPGLLVLAMGEQAMAARQAMPTVPAYYGDVLNWLPVMQNPSRYFATPPVNLIVAYETGLEGIFAEGLPARYARHRAQARAFRAAMRSMGFTVLAEEDLAAPTVSCLLYPRGIEDVAFRKALAQRGVIVAGGLAHLQGKAFRLGHLGNVTARELRQAVIAMAEVLQEMGNPVDREPALSAFEGLPA
jgi:aspartate aminotransferase-like enzyme